MRNLINDWDFVRSYEISIRSHNLNIIFIFTRKITEKKLLTEMRNKWEKILKFIWETNLVQHFFLMRKKSHKISCWFFNEFSIRTHTEKLFVTLLSLCMKRNLVAHENLWFVRSYFWQIEKKMRIKILWDLIISQLGISPCEGNFFFQKLKLDSDIEFSPLDD